MHFQNWNYGKRTPYKLVPYETVHSICFVNVAGSLVGGMSNSLVDGNSFGTSLVKGLVDGAIGGLSGGVVGGISAGIAATADGRDFWHGGRITTDVKMDLKQIFQLDDSKDCRYATYESFNKHYNGTSENFEELKNSFPKVPTNDLQHAKMYNRSHMGINEIKNFKDLDKLNKAITISEYLKQNKGVSYEFWTSEGAHATAITRVRIYDNGKILINLMNPARGSNTRIRNFGILRKIFWVQKF